MSKRSHKSTPTTLTGSSYFDLSKEPLYILIFLLPLVVYYEAALYISQTNIDGANIQIKAHYLLERFFESFDLPATQGLGFGGIIIILIFLVWHLIIANRWAIDWKVIVFMAIESIILAIPLLIFGTFLGGLVVATEGSSFELLLTSERLAVSIGAGLYEELVFRMIIIGFVHTIVCNIFKQSDRAGLIAGVVFSSVLFALYHVQPNAIPQPEFSLFFLLGAGAYLGFLFVTRGFGIAAATHAAYDVVAITIIPIFTS
jgi:membrane protease YdiL (CAAX protease family)